MDKKRQRTNGWFLKGWGLLAITALLSLSTVVGMEAQTRAILHRTPAEYPALAEKMHISGTVTVLASVEPSGSVTAARAITGHAMLRPAAEKAVMHWKFASAPKPEETTIDIQFQLRDEATR